MKYIVNSTAYYAVSETKPETPTQYPPDESVWSNLPPDTDENVWSTRATSYSDGTFEYSEVIVNGGDTTPSVAPDTKTYYKVLPVGSEAPAKPTDNPPSGWEEEEPEYDTQEYDEYSIIVYTYDDGTFTVSEPQLKYKPEDDEPAYEEPETFFYYIVVANGAGEPDVPTTNPPPSPWVDTEPEYEYVSQDLYSISVSVYSDGTFEYGSVQKETAPEEKTLELAAGNGVYYSASEPTGGEYNDGDVWFCTASEGDNAGGIFIYNKHEDGTGSWIAHQVGTVSIKDGSIVADKIVINDVFASLVLSRDITATGKITATKLTITGDSKLQDITASDITLSGNINAANGTINGARLVGASISCATFELQRGEPTDEGSLVIDANGMTTVDGYSYNLFNVLQYAQNRNIQRSLIFGYDSVSLVCGKLDPEVSGYATVSGLYANQNGTVTIVGAQINLNGGVDNDATTVTIGGSLEIADSLTVGGDVYIGGKFSVHQLQSNPISTNSYDTTANWAAQGSSVNWYSVSGCLYSQPSQYGYLLNLAGAGEDVHQIWAEQPSGKLFHRSGNRNGWNGNGSTTGAWKTIVDSSNIAGYIPVASGSTRGGVKMQMGTAGPINAAAGSYGEISVSFSGFSATPVLFVCMASQSTSKYLGGVTCSGWATSATKGVIRVHNSTSTAFPSSYVRWVAISLT